MNNAVLGIDAAWTGHNPSGVALLRCAASGWSCTALAPSYESFIGLADGFTVDWSARAIPGSEPDPAALLGAAERLLDGEKVTVIAVDMPLSLSPIVGRRPADAQVSRRFGKYGCAVHSPTPARPGAISTKLRDGFAGLGFPIATAASLSGVPSVLLEVYPHPALLSLLGLERRLPYKTARARRYWPEADAFARVARLLENFERVLAALRTEIGGIDLPLPNADEVSSLSGLKKHEDALDALVCGWVGIRYLESGAIPFGDETAAIWCPEG